MPSESLAPPRPPHIVLNSGNGRNLGEGIRSDGSNSSIGTNAGNTRQLLPNQSGPYGTPAVADSSEMLLAPGRARAARSYENMPYDTARSQSALSSRRTSWSSEAGGPFVSPFEDRFSRASSTGGESDEEPGLNTQTVSEKYNIMPSEGLLLFPEDVEKDDYLHNPSLDDKEGPGCDVFSKRGMMNIGGLFLITMGVAMLFIGYPVL